MLHYMSVYSVNVKNSLLGVEEGKNVFMFVCMGDDDILINMSWL